MNGFERIHAALSGKKPDKIPITLHNFMVAAKEAGFSQAQYRNDPGNIARVFIQAVETYEYDGVLVDIDTVTLAGALGVPVDFPECECARTHEGNLKTLAQIRDLPRPDVLGYKYVNIWLEATCKFIEAMAQTGADILSNGDSVAGPAMISPVMYGEFALPYEKKVCGTAHEYGLPYVLHICGNTDPILHLLIETGADGLELDYLTNIKTIFETFHESVTFLGNIDPSGILAQGSSDDVRNAVAELLDTYAGSSRFILNAGCALPSTTPQENIKTMIQTAREYRNP